MEWAQLLSAERLGAPADVPAGPNDVRTPFERDYGRILFSNAFRRLHNKTQVFPIPDNDHVHSRLTHSLEVANVGATLGKMIGGQLVARHGLERHGLTPGHFGDTVSAACLAHDIGNPPFGHAGEAAIGYYFTRGPGAQLIEGLPPARQADFTHFEGNAQGFRLIARTQLYAEEGGMRLTKAVLGAFSKYPQSSVHRGDGARPGGKKFGFFAAEAALFEEVAAGCALPPVDGRPGAWHRHPLAYVMEAADDICYHVLDLEDGVMLRLVDERTARELFGALLDRAPSELVGRPVTALRALAINRLVGQVVDAFLAAESALLAARQPHALADGIPLAATLREVKASNIERCYRSEIVLGLEQTGFNVIGSLLDNLLGALYERRNPHLLRLLSDLPVDPARVDDPELRYEQLLRITDYVSGMTDRYALRKYQQWNGIDLTSV